MRSGFWRGLLEKYSCDEGEYNSIEPLPIGNRFIYYYKGRWKGTNIVVTKVAKDSVYFGTQFPMNLIVKPVKVPILELQEESIERISFQKRVVFTMPNIGHTLSKISLKCSVVEQFGS